MSTNSTVITANTTVKVTTSVDKYLVTLTPKSKMTAIYFTADGKQTVAKGTSVSVYVPFGSEWNAYTASNTATATYDCYGDLIVNGKNQDASNASGTIAGKTTITATAPYNNVESSGGGEG